MAHAEIPPRLTIGPPRSAGALDFAETIDDALEEFIRYASPVIVFTRTATVGTELHGVPIAAGDKVALFYCSGNRDATVFTSPGAFDLRRPRARHVAFGGGGVHFCLGAPLARMELVESLSALWSTIPDLRLAGDPESRGTFVLRGFHRVPVGQGGPA